MLFERMEIVTVHGSLFVVLMGDGIIEFILQCNAVVQYRMERCKSRRHAAGVWSGNSLCSKVVLNRIFENSITFRAAGAAGFLDVGKACAANRTHFVVLLFNFF